MKLPLVQLHLQLVFSTAGASGGGSSATAI
jgi:hypothetical protein